MLVYFAVAPGAITSICPCFTTNRLNLHLKQSRDPGLEDPPGAGALTHNLQINTLNFYHYMRKEQDTTMT